MGFVCLRCRKSISGNIKGLFIHLRGIHSVNFESQHFQCCEDGCGKTFPYIRSLRTHLQTHNPDTEAEDFGRTIPELQPERYQLKVREQVEEVEVEEGEDWDGLDDEGITERVALFLAKLRSNSANTLTSVTHVMWHTSDLVSDIVGSLQTKTMAPFEKFGHL